MPRLARLALLALCGCSAHLDWIRGPQALAAVAPADVQVVIPPRGTDFAVDFADGISWVKEEPEVEPPHQLVGVIKVDSRHGRGWFDKDLEGTLREEAAARGANYVVYSQNNYQALLVRLGELPPEPRRSLDEQVAAVSADHAGAELQKSWDGDLASLWKFAFDGKPDTCYAFAVVLDGDAQLSSPARRWSGVDIRPLNPDQAMMGRVVFGERIKRSQRAAWAELGCATRQQPVEVSFVLSSSSGDPVLGAGKMRAAVFSRAPADGEIAQRTAAGREATEEMRRRLCSRCWGVGKEACAVPLAICNPYLLCLRRSWGLSYEYCKPR